MRVAPEGWPFTAVGFAVLTALAGLGWWRGGWWAAPAFLWLPVALWVPWFFRDPARTGPRDPSLVIAPADGKVVEVTEVNEPDFLGSRATRVSVFMDILAVHVNRHPADGTVRYRRYVPGRFINATLDKASEQNERMSLGIDTPRGRLLVRQIAGLIARRIVTDARVGDTVYQGDRLGMIRFGSRVDTFLPLSAKVLVRTGDRTKCGQTVIAEWPA